MLGVFVFPLCLLLHSVGGSEFPDFGDDYYLERYVCEGDACATSTIYIRFDKNIQVPNKTIAYVEDEYFDVITVGLLADCAPSLSIGDIASRMKSCQEVNWKYEDACMYRKKGWLGQDGKTVNESLGTDFMVIEGVSENIMKCLDWDGDYEYDWDSYNSYDSSDYYDYYDIDDMEESDDVKIRAKREQKSNVPEFMIQKTRMKRNNNKKANVQKEKHRHLKKRGNRKGKDKGKHGRKSGKKENKSGKKGKKHGQKMKKSARKGKKGGKGRSNLGKRKHRRAKKANKKRKNGQNNKKKGNDKKNENKKKREERKKKLLKELGYDSMPSKEIMNQLVCVERAIQYGLEKCGEKIFRNLERP